MIRPATQAQPTDRHPRVSVITVFHQRRQLAREYLRAWELNGAAGFAGVELLLGDNASNDGTRELVRAWNQPCTSLEEFPKNLDFARANNTLARKARGEILVFLNYDVGFTGRWLEELVAPFEDRPALGIVGNVQLSVRARAIDHAGVFFEADGTPFHFRPALDHLQRLDLLPVPAVTGACLAIRRELFERIGGFHEGYRNSHEDVELCLQARQLSYDVAVATRSVIWHYIGSSPGRQDRETDNARLFEQRCGAQARDLARFAPPDLAPAGTVRTPAQDPLDASDTLQVYYDCGDGILEQDSTVHLYRRGRWNRIEIACRGGAPSQPTRIRFDPSRSPGLVRFGGLALKHSRSRTSIAFKRGRDLSPLADIGGTARSIPDPRSLAIESTGHDPQVTFRLDAVFPAIPDDAVLELWLRADTPNRHVATSTPSSKGAGFRWPIWLRPRRVLADLSRLSPGGLNGGVKIFVIEMLEAVARRHRFRLKIDVVASAAVCAEISQIAPILRCHPAADCRDAKARAAAGNADVLYAPIGYSEFSRPDLPQVTLLVDVLHRDIAGALPGIEVAIRDKWFAESICRSTVVQCMSRFVVDRLRHHYGNPAASTVVVCSAVGQAHRRARVAPPSTPYFFYPANDWPHKNHERLLAAYAEYRRRKPATTWDLKLSGHFADESRITAAIDRFELASSVAVLGHLPERSFLEVFSNAGALVFPSRYEGFGMPVLEAFRLEVPVICSTAGSLPEVGATACGFFDPDDTAAIAGAMTRVSADAGWRSSLVAAGRARALDFNLAHEADKLAAVFRELA